MGGTIYPRGRREYSVGIDGVCLPRARRAMAHRSSHTCVVVRIHTHNDGIIGEHDSPKHKVVYYHEGHGRPLRRQSRIWQPNHDHEDQHAEGQDARRPHHHIAATNLRIAVSLYRCRRNNNNEDCQDRNGFSGTGRLTRSMVHGNG